MSSLPKFATTAALCIAMGLTAPAPADAKGKTKKKSKVRAHKNAKSARGALPAPKNYDFLADDIDGDRVRPDDTTIFGIENLKHTSLIRLREHFINEIGRSAEML